MTETTQLGLPIYGDNDVPDWMNTNDGFEALDSLVNSCADVQLDFAHPLHKFTTGNLTFTTTKECYLYGTINASQNTFTTLTIDGNAFASVTGSRSDYHEQGFEIGPIRLNSGTVVTLSSQGWNPNLYILEGTIVSGNTYVFNEAQVTLDYANPLHTFSGGDSYTATEDCWLVGTGSNLAVMIDGRRIVDSNSSLYINMSPIKIAKGQTVTTTGSPSSIQLYALKGTVTGSVGALHSDIPDYSNLIASLAYNDETYTATEECIVEFYFLSATLDNMAKVAVNNHVIGVTYNDTNTHMHFYKSIHLQKGDVLTWYGANQNLFVCNVFGLL